LCAFAGMDVQYEKTRKIKVSGDGSQTRDWVHAADVADAFECALFKSEIVGVTVDVCTGIQTSINELAKLLNVPAEYTASRPGDAQSLVSDPDPARVLLNFLAKKKLKTCILDAFPTISKEKISLSPSLVVRTI
jgi:nucleoside-diphosphate-sugar epimerase